MRRVVLPTVLQQQLLLQWALLCSNACPQRVFRRRSAHDWLVWALLGFNVAIASANCLFV